MGPVTHLALQIRGGNWSVELGEGVFSIPAQGGRRRGFFFGPSPPPQNHSHFPIFLLWEFGEVSVDDLELLVYARPPTPPSASRGLTLPDCQAPSSSPGR